jgi:hypothetical protein
MSAMNEAQRPAGSRPAGFLHLSSRGRLPNLPTRRFKTGHSWILNQILMVSAGLRTYIRNCVGVVSIGIDLSPPCARERSMMPRNFGFPKPVDSRDQWPLAVFVAVVLVIAALGIFIA